MDGIWNQPETMFEGYPVHELVIDGYTRGMRWNGWSCPYFTREQADRLTEVSTAFNASLSPEMAECSEDITYDEARDAYVITSSDYPDEPQYISPTLIDGVKYYCIGAFSWTWREERVG
jgi:hypothetical protein